MVKCKQDYIGNKYNHLTIIKQVDDYIEPNNNRKHRPQFLCKCDCKQDNPNMIIARLDCLKNNHTSSCGCLKLKHTLEICNNNRKPMKDEKSLKLNLQDDEHMPFGKCKVSNTDDYFYFSMCDYELIKNYCWYLNMQSSGYHRLVTMKGKIPFAMHQIFGMSCPDHINRNPLDNRRENLDNFASKQIQMQNRGLQINNTSGCKGVDWVKKPKKWRARIKVNYKEINIGLFNEKDDAIVSRLLSEKKYFDKRSWQTHLMEQYKLLDRT